MISNVRGKSILNPKHERRDYIEPENAYKGGHKDSGNQVKISNTLKIKSVNGEVETVEMQNLKTKVQQAAPKKVNSSGQTVSDFQQEVSVQNERSFNVNQQQMLFGLASDYISQQANKTAMPKIGVH